MKTWNYSLFLSITSFCNLLITFFLPGYYSTFRWGSQGADAGKLFPVMLLIWAISLVAFAMNNVFVDKCYVDNNLKMPALLKYLPSLLSIPSFISFIWFIYTLLRGSQLFRVVAQIVCL